VFLGRQTRALSSRCKTVSPLSDKTTKFSKFINKKKSHLSKKILQCAANLTGVAWQKKSHYKYFKDRSNY
jgi:hypothetical protein